MKPTHFSIRFDIPERDHAVKLQGFLAESDRFRYSVAPQCWSDEYNRTITAIEVECSFIDNLYELSAWAKENINDQEGENK